MVIIPVWLLTVLVINTSVLMAIRQWLCSHECDYMRDLIRISPEAVECKCRRCGKVLTAPYGLALNAKLVKGSTP